MTDLRTLFAAVAGVGVGLTLIVFGVRELLEGLRTRAWPRAPGAITVSRLEEGPRDRWFIRQYRSVLSYAFDAGGKTWTGHRITVDSNGHDLSYLGSARARIDRYPVGAQVDVYFDPSDPSKTVLEPGVPSQLVFALLFGVCFASVGAWLFLGRR